MKLLIALAIPILTIISWLSVGYWSKATEDLEEKNNLRKRQNKND